MITAVLASTPWAPREPWIIEPIQIQNSGTPAPTTTAATISTTNRPVLPDALLTRLSMQKVAVHPPPGRAARN